MVYLVMLSFWHLFQSTLMPATVNVQHISTFRHRRCNQNYMLSDSPLTIRFSDVNQTGFSNPWRAVQVPGSWFAAWPSQHAHTTSRYISTCYLSQTYHKYFSQCLSESYLASISLCPGWSELRFLHANAGLLRIKCYTS